MKHIINGFKWDIAPMKIGGMSALMAYISFSHASKPKIITNYLT